MTNSIWTFVRCPLVIGREVLAGVLASCLTVVAWAAPVFAVQQAIPATRLNTVRGTPVQGTATASGAVVQEGVPPVPGQVVSGQVVGGEAVADQTPQVDVAAGRKSLLQQLRVDRRPSVILAAWVELNQPQPEEAAEDEAEPEDESAAEGGEEAETPEPTAEQLELEAFGKLVEEVSVAVTLGDWAAVRLFVEESLKEDERPIFFDRLVQQLAATPNQIPADLPPEVQQQLAQLRSMQGQNQQGQPEQNQIDWEVVNAVIGFLPAEPTDAQIMSLGRLARVGLTQGHLLETWLESLRVFIVAEGDEEAILTERQVAKILGAANLKVETKEFLPSVEEAEAAGDLEGLNLLTEMLLAQHAKTRELDYLEQAWLATQAVLATTQKSKEHQAQKEVALRMAVQLAPQVKEELGQAWLNGSFQGAAERGQEILASIGSVTSKGLQTSANNRTLRLENLQLQKTAVDALLEVSPELAHEWRDVLNLLAISWLRECEVSYRYDTSTSLNPVLQRDIYGNYYYVNPNGGISSMGGFNPAMNNQRGMSAIATGELLELRPSETWMSWVHASLRPQFDVLTAQLFLKVGQEDKALPYIESLAEVDQGRTQELVDEFLRVWTSNHDPNANTRQRSSYIYMYGFEQRAQSIPLTRSKQQRNLEELADLLKRLKQLPVELDEKQVLTAFTTCHSTAEVYRIEAIQSVFGELESIDPKTLASLAQGMRMNLVGLWRLPATQESAKTKRRKKDIQIEVQRGYEVAKQVIAEALGRYPNDWSLMLAGAALAHDESSFLAEVAPSNDFASRQDGAFAQFRAAAEAYVGQVETMTEDDWSTDPFEVWFYASLGACDLRQINVDKQPDAKQAALIREVLDSMPSAIAEGHVDQMANHLFTRMSSLSPEAKFRYLRGGFELVGDHPQAREARDVYDYYRDLVTEIQLVVEIDGGDVVGHDQPFGVFVNLRHTLEIERESGGFSRYLQNQNASNTYSYNYGRPREDYRDKFEEAARMALNEDFEVLSVTFQTEDVNSRALPQEGWRETSYAYLLLKARTEEVDEISPLRLDLDFLDTSGYVVLPIESSIIPIDATASDDEPRPFDNLTLTQTLDERQAEDGKLIVEIKAAAEGLVPELETLVDCQTSGFEVVEIDDQGVSVNRFDPTSSDKVIQSERSWMVTYQAASQSEVPKEYTFASPKVETVENVYQRFSDADLVSVPAVVSLEARYARQGILFYVLGGIGMVLVVGVVLGFGLWFGLRNTDEGGPVSDLRMPESVTPFSVLALLNELEHRRGIAASDAGEFQAAREQIERAYFGKRNGEPAPDLGDVARTWLKRSTLPTEL